MSAGKTDHYWSCRRGLVPISSDPMAGALPMLNEIGQGGESRPLLLLGGDMTGCTFHAGKRRQVGRPA